MSMYREFRTILGVAALAGFLAAGVAQAQEAQFTFSVKTDFQDLHQDVTVIILNCSVCSGETCTPVNSLGGSSVTSPTKGETSFNDSITVAVNVDDGVDPLDAKSWRCGFLLSSPGSGRGIEPSPDADQIKYRTTPGAKLVTELSGQIQ